MQKRGIFVPRSVNCHLCKLPESVEHVFIYCWNAVFFWDVLKRTLKKELYITDPSIRYLPVHTTEKYPYDMIILLCLYCIWRSRMAVRHADIDVQPVHFYFIELTTRVQAVLESLDVTPEWIGLFHDLANAHWT